MADYDEVCILIPTYNEAETVAEVVEQFQAKGFENIFVIDGGSTDGTQERATEAGARVEEQSGEGKGQAVREAVGMIDAPYVVMIDGDATYRPGQVDRLLEPLFAGSAEHVLGNRFADMKPGAMTRLNQVGNRIINKAFRFIHGRNLEDILTGYRAFTRDSFERLSLSADGFGIETEMSVECVKHNVLTAVVPVTYDPRPDESETNLHPIRDGGAIIVRLYQMARKNNPIFYFGSLGVLSALAGTVLAGYVGYAWFIQGISREVMALASGVSILFGLQLIMFGVLSDLVVTANREQMRRLDRISEKLEELDGESPRTGTADTDTVTTSSEADDTEQKADPKQEQH